MIFTRALSFDEQRQLTTKQMEAYIDWFLSRPMSARRIDEQRWLNRDYRVVGSIHDYEVGE